MVRASKPALVLTGDSVIPLVVSFVVLSFVVSLVVSVVVSLTVSFVVTAVVEMNSIAVVFVDDVDVSGKTVSTDVSVVVVEGIVIVDVSDTDAVDTGVELFIEFVVGIFENKVCVVSGSGVVVLNVNGRFVDVIETLVDEANSTLVAVKTVDVIGVFVVIGAKFVVVVRIAGDVEFFGVDVVGARVDRAVVDAVNKVVGVEISYVLDVAVVGTGVVVNILVVVLLGVVVVLE